jgi:outer membrane protein assembly factor BamE
MQKLLIPITLIASFFLQACSQDPIVNRLPFVYRIDIQQGNVLTQDKVNQIRTGMSQRQVQFVLGAPMLTDPFHADRWDYFYSFKPGSSGDQEARQQHLILFFDEQQRIARIDGTILPKPGETQQAIRQVTITVPPQERDDPGILTRMWRWMNFGRDH